MPSPAIRAYLKEVAAIQRSGEFHRAANHLDLLVGVQRRRLAGSADRHDAIGAAARMKIDQPTKRIEVDAPRLIHRRD